MRLTLCMAVRDALPMSFEPHFRKGASMKTKILLIASVILSLLLLVACDTTEPVDTTAPVENDTVPPTEAPTKKPTAPPT